MFLTPHKLNFKLLMKTQKRKMKRMHESCLVYCYSGIQSLFEVVLLYTFYTDTICKRTVVRFQENKWSFE